MEERIAVWVNTKTWYDVDKHIR